MELRGRRVREEGDRGGGVGQIVGRRKVGLGGRREKRRGGVWCGGGRREGGIEGGKEGWMMGVLEGERKRGREREERGC